MSYYDWVNKSEEIKQYEGLKLKSAFADSFDSETRSKIVSNGSSPEEAQSLLNKQFGEKALLVGMRNTKRDLLDAYRYIRFDYIEVPEA